MTSTHHLPDSESVWVSSEMLTGGHTFNYCTALPDRTWDSSNAPTLPSA